MKALPTRRSSAHRARLGLELLEARETPAGVVTLSEVNNTITLIGDGDAAGNEVQVLASANGNFQLNGLNGTTFLVNKANVGASIDTSAIAGFAFVSDVTKLSVKFLGGPDRFEYDGVTNGQPIRKFSDIVIDTGAGNDTVLLRQFIGKTLTINSAAPAVGNTDNDVVTVAAGGVLELDPLVVGAESYSGGVRTNLTINGQTGNDTALLAVNAGGTITGNFKDAGDSFTLKGNSRIGGSVIVNETPTTVLGVNAFTIDETVEISQNVTFNNLNNAANALVRNTNIAGNLLINSGSGVGGSTYTIKTVNVGGNLDVKDGPLADTLIIDGFAASKNVALTMGAGGSVNDLVNAVVIQGNFSATYGAGDDSFALKFSTISGNATITNSDGDDRLNVFGCSIDRNFTYNGGNGGNGGPGSPDVLTATIGGTCNVAYGSGNDALTVEFSIINAATTIKMGEGTNRLTCPTSTFMGSFTFTGGLSADTFNATGMQVFGTSSITTGGGNDVVNITVQARFKGKLTLNTGGAGSDNDTINLQADSGKESQFLGGVSVNTGAGNDTTNIGTAAGKVYLFNGLTYPNITAPLDVVTLGANLIQL